MKLDMLLQKTLFTFLLPAIAASAAQSNTEASITSFSTSCSNAVSLVYCLHFRYLLTAPKCAQLSKNFGSKLHYHNEGFTVWDAKQQETQSACRVEPSSAQDVSSILTILLNNWCNFAVKGGGHSRDADDSVSVGGVTIDLQLMKSLKVAPDRKSVSLGSGHVLYTMYHGLEAFNLSTIGGRVADVGLGGYALGGGISDLSPKYGLAVDNILEYEVCVE
jgi:hypothetical protein